MTLLGLCLLVALLGAACGPAQGAPAPVDQPIQFDHTAHAEAEIECVRCHRGAETVKRAGLPGVAACAACHRRILQDHPEVIKVLEAWETKTPIQWIKVHDIGADAMAHFHHGAHAVAGVGCAECHGDVASMSVAVAQRNVADMGWCVDCHRERSASDDCLTCHY